MFNLEALSIMKANVRIGRGTAREITITFPCDLVHVTKIKAVEGSEWHPKEKDSKFTESNEGKSKITAVRLCTSYRKSRKIN